MIDSVKEDRQPKNNGKMLVTLTVAKYCTAVMIDGIVCMVIDRLGRDSITPVLLSI